MGNPRRANYSGLSLLRNALGSKPWPNIFPTPSLQPTYDIVIVGGGGHGLATAHYLATRHNITNIAVLERGWLGGGNTARNTAIVRSDYLLDASFELKNFALELWESLGSELGFNLMYSPRGYIDLAHSDGELEDFVLRANAMCVRGADANILNREELKARVPLIDLDENARYPITGALVQEKGGIVRHDAVAWGFAKSACEAGVHIFQHCPVTGFELSGGKINTVATPKGTIRCNKVLISVAGASSLVASLAELTLPLESINVQAFVSEPVKPALDVVVNYNAGLSYISQTDKGEFILGGTTDGYPSYAKRGSFDRIEDVIVRAIQIFPFLSQLRMMRHWSGTADIPMDGNAIMGATPIENLFLNCGWGYAGFKATPAVGWLLADLLARETTPPQILPFSLERFVSGHLIDDSGIGPYPWLH